MTGYARIDGTIAIDRLGQNWTWGWELKSVNARGLDLRCRFPSGAERLEAETRKAISGRLTRGSVTAHLTMQRQVGAIATRINRGLLRDVMALQEELEADGLVFPSPPRLDVLLTVRGMVDADDVEELGAEERAVVDAAARAGLTVALDQLVAMRGEEGARLHDVLSAQLVTLEGLRDQAAVHGEGRIDMFRERIQAQMSELLQASPPVAEERLAQELAVIVSKADVREEIDRLGAHLQACRDHLASGEAVGRRLDFLCQELNREANTICSKSADLSLTAIGLDLKSGIERFREQVQNVE